MQVIVEGRELVVDYIQDYDGKICVIAVVEDRKGRASEAEYERMCRRLRNISLLHGGIDVGVAGYDDEDRVVIVLGVIDKECDPDNYDGEYEKSTRILCNIVQNISSPVLDEEDELLW